MVLPIVVASKMVACGGRSGRRKVTCLRCSPYCQTCLGPWFRSPVEGELLVRSRRCVVAVATQFLTHYFYISEKIKILKKEKNPKISWYKGKIEQIENLIVNAGSNRTNWKSRTKLKEARKLRADFDFYPLKTL